MEETRPARVSLRPQAACLQASQRVESMRPAITAAKTRNSTSLDPEVRIWKEGCFRLSFPEEGGINYDLQIDDDYDCAGLQIADCILLLTD